MTPDTLRHHAAALTPQIAAAYGLERKEVLQAAQDALEAAAKQIEEMKEKVTT